MNVNDLHAMQTMLAQLCTGLLILGSAVWLATRAFAEAARLVRALGRTRTTRILSLAFACGIVLYGGSKSTFRFDRGLSDAGSSSTNDTVHVAWNYQSPVLSVYSVYIDAQQHGTTNWIPMVETTAGEMQSNFTIENATNYDFYVYAWYEPPVPVHTNGVWQGGLQRTVDGKSYITVHGYIEQGGTVLAPPDQKRKANQ